MPHVVTTEACIEACLEIAEQFGDPLFLHTTLDTRQAFLPSSPHVGSMVVPVAANSGRIVQLQQSASSIID
jgi:hypothetical protein